MLAEHFLFGGVVTYLFIMDLWLNRGKEMTLTRATSWSIMYVVIALIFAAWVWYYRGSTDAQMFITAYALEKVLSVDNLVVFSAVFAYFGIEPINRHRILRWGIIGAAVMRLAFVYLGTTLFDAMETVMAVLFSILVALAGVAVLKQSEPKSVDHDSRWYTRLLKKWFPVVSGPKAEGKFFVRGITREGSHFKHYWCITPGLLCLVAIEMTDVLFAVDSVPVVIAVARDPFIVYTAMIFAILGLRAMYFVLDALQSMLRHMNLAVGVVLFFVAGKLLAQAFGFHLPPITSLVVVMGILSAGVVGSLIDRKEPA